MANSRSSRSFPAWRHCLLSVLYLASSVSAAVIERQTQDPPQKPLVYRLNVGDFNATLKRFLPAAKAVYAEGLKPSLEDATFENTIQIMADLDVEASLILTPLYIYPSVAETQELRRGASRAVAAANDALRKSSASPDLYARVEKVYKQFERDGKLDTTEGILTKSWYNDLQGTGGGLSEGPAKDRFLEIVEKMSDNQDTFGENINAINTTLFFTHEELDGVKQTDLDNLVKGEGQNEGKFGLKLASASDSSKVQTFAKRYVILVNQATVYTVLTDNVTPGGTFGSK